MGTPRIDFTIQVTGAGELVLDVDLPSEPLELDGTTPGEVDVNINNPLSVAVEFTALAIERIGAGADALVATLLQDAFTIAPGGSLMNRVTVEATQPIPPYAELGVRVHGNGRVV